MWGYDERIASYDARLWRNESPSDAPEVWLSGTNRCYPWPGCIALAIVEGTGQDPVSVVHALGLADPDPTLRSHAKIADAIVPLSRAGATRSPPASSPLLPGPP